MSNEELIQWLRDFANFFIEGTESYVNLLEAADRLAIMSEHKDGDEDDDRA